MIFFDCAKALSEKIKSFSSDKELFIVAIDGRCASGKTTLAKAILQELDCNVIHTDDFYLQPHQRTKERLAAAGGNLDRKRLLNQVLIPLKKGREVCYRPFICTDMSFGEERKLSAKKIIVIEGSYSCHPDLREYYNMTVFLDVGKQTQLKRIRERNGEEKLRVFVDKWIPLEEEYFKAYKIKEKANLVISTDLE